MSAAAIVQLVLGLLQIVLANLKASPVTTGLEQAISGIEAAITNLQTVQGTPVTFAQLESLRVEPKW